MLSIIVPTLDEAEGVTDMLSRLGHLRERGAEVIVADGGSDDGTPHLAALFADRVVTGPPGRAAQMNAGAELARGETLLFLHADTVLPEDADWLIAAALAGSGRVWGRFDVRIAGRHRALRLVAFMMNLRSRLSGIATGDQAIFVTSDAFASVGGYPPLPLMEDIALSSALKRLSRPACLAATVRTSGRRWEKNGVLRTVLLMWWLRAAYCFGADPARLARIYRRG